MGTSGAYGGSTGSDDIRRHTLDWLDSGGGAGDVHGGEGESDAQSDSVVAGAGQPDGPTTEPGSTSPSANLALGDVLAALGRTIATGTGAIGAGSGGSGGARGGGSGGGGGGGGRSSTRASSAGGRALGGAWGVRTGNAAAVAELGLNLAELQGLSKYQQAQRILDAAMGPRGDVLASEMRQANASVVMWALTEPVTPSPIEMASRWVIEYVWATWVTEAGPQLQERCATADERIRAEQEMRATLEVRVAAQGLPADRALTGTDFAHAIKGALDSLNRIGRAAT